MIVLEDPDFTDFDDPVNFYRHPFPFEVERYGLSPKAWVNEVTLELLRKGTDREKEIVAAINAEAARKN